jgi:hypothetical protein
MCLGMHERAIGDSDRKCNSDCLSFEVNDEVGSPAREIKAEDLSRVSSKENPSGRNRLNSC